MEEQNKLSNYISCDSLSKIKEDYNSNNSQHRENGRENQIISFNEEKSINSGNIDDNNFNNIEGGIKKDEVKSFCVSIFMNFSKFCKEEFQFLITYQNIVKILKLVNIIGNDETCIKNYEIDAILKKANPKGKKYTLKQFMNFIVFLANRLETEIFQQDPKLCLMKIIKKYFEPLNNYIEEQITGGMAGDYFQHTIVQKYLNMVHIDSNNIFLLNSIHPGLNHIYNAYFYFENHHMKETDKIYRNSLEGLIEFCKDFDIMNHVASLDKIATYFNFLIEMTQEQITKNSDCPLIFDKSKESGKLFTLSKFAGFLVHLSIISFEKNSKFLENIAKRRKTLVEMGFSIENFGNSEKLILLLDKFDNGEGISKLEQRTTKGYTSKISLLPPRETIMNINPIINKTIEENFAKVPSLNNLNKSTNNEKSISNMYYSNNSKVISELDLKEIFKNIDFNQNESLWEKLLTNMDNFKHIFENYSTIGFKTDIYNMSLSGFIKFAVDADIITQREFEYQSNKERTENFGSNNANFNSNNYNSAKSEKNLIILQKVSGKKPNQSKLSASNDSETFKEKNINNSINQANLNSFSVRNTKNNKTSEIFSGNKIFKSDLNLIYYYLCGLKNFDISKKIRSQFDKNRGFNPNFENSLKGPSLDKNNLMKADNEVKPLKMNFMLFLKSFESFASKIYKEYPLPQALDFFIENNIQNILKNKSEGLSLKKNYLEILNEMRRDDIFEIMRIIIPLIYPHYLNYCDKYELIDFELFNQFFRDFDLFPQILNLVQLKSIFFTLQELIISQLNISKDAGIDPNYKNEIIKKFKINFDFFMDAILLTSVHLKGIDESNEIEKIIYVVERMSVSKGISKSQMRSGLTFSSNREFKTAIKEIKGKLGIIPTYSQKNILKSDNCFDEIFQ